MTVALNNPTPVHYDDNNFGLTFLICFELDEAGSLQGGSHTVYSLDQRRCVGPRRGSNVATETPLWLTPRARAHARRV